MKRKYFNAWQAKAARENIYPQSPYWARNASLANEMEPAAISPHKRRCAASNQAYSRWCIHTV
jgi:hypothetical protein